jgi:hypothetical protein
VFRDPELARPADVAGQLRERGIGQEAPVEVLDGAAALADQVVMVTRELLGQLESLTAPERGLDPHGVRGSDEAKPDEQVHRPVHRHDVSPASTQARVDLRHRQRHSAVSQHVEDGSSRARQSQPSTREEVRQRVSNLS